jgi:hypothetical protein
MRRAVVDIEHSVALGGPSRPVREERPGTSFASEYLRRPFQAFCPHTVHWKSSSSNLAPMTVPETVSTSCST